MTSIRFILANLECWVVHYNITLSSETGMASTLVRLTKNLIPPPIAASRGFREGFNSGSSQQPGRVSYRQVGDALFPLVACPRHAVLPRRRREHRRLMNNEPVYPSLCVESAYAQRDRGTVAVRSVGCAPITGKCECVCVVPRVNSSAPSQVYSAIAKKSRPATKPAARWDVCSLWRS